MKSASRIREEFFRFFEERGHTRVPSDSLVPAGDQTLLFTNAGMNQFKDVFLGEGEREYDRAVDTQKCLRVSGKHNDLDEVGYDTYHHTFFEMLGNWSFGDYFKKEAIGWAWELLTEVWGLDGDRLYATVHEGDDDRGLTADTESADLWKSETGIEPDHILFCSSKDNFWMMGDTGPCGPCSEIHIDMRSDTERASIPGRDLVNADDPRVIEIWNLVFIQYNALGDGTLKPLADRHVDTGMGFERLVAVLQEKSSNYDTDLFGPILDRIAELAPSEDLVSYAEMTAFGADEAERIRIAMRVIADHVRTLTFAISDGVIPGNTGRGYVIRRILRRAVRYGYQTLGFREPFMHLLVGTVQSVMKDAFPDLAENRPYVERVVRAEEESFLETLGTGIEYFESIVPYLKRAYEGTPIDELSSEVMRARSAMDLLEKAYDDASREKIVADMLASGSDGKVPGEVAFLLHDTYGFPVDLTELMAREEGLSIDRGRYGELMAEQRERARSAAAFTTGEGAGDGWTVVRPDGESAFTGYDTVTEAGANVTAMRTVEKEGAPPRHEIVLDRTPFYAESGGQIGDTGVIRIGDEQIEVLDTQKRGDRIVHVVDRLPADADAPVEAVVDAARRERIMKHHTVTHLLHAALREELGDHVAQKGSLVAPDHLRFDFAHFERVSPAELRTIENRVNEVIQANIARREDRDVPIEEALSRGATALFGEKYGDRVRVITFDPDYSVELCGGTHVGATGEIGLFRFTSEGSVAAGIRRVEAVAGMDALEYVRRELEELSRVRGQFKSLQRPSDEEVADLIDAQKRMEKQVDALRVASLEQELGGIVSSAENIGGVRVATGRVDAPDIDTLRTLGEKLRDRLGAGAVGVLGTADEAEGKVYLCCSVADDVVSDQGLKAGDLVGSIARIVGGGGGGRPTLATAGGRQPEKLDEALGAVAAYVRENIG